MATERIVNVAINYKVNTVEVEKVEAASKRADDATQRLRASTQSYASTGAQGYKGVGTSIEAMRIEMQRTKAIIDLTNATDTKRLNELSARYKQLNSQIKQQTDLYIKQSQAVKDNAKNTQTLSENFGQVVGAVRAFVGFQIAKEAVNISLEMSKLAGNVEGVSRAFERRFPNSVQLLGDLKNATHETVSDFELMQRTLQATNLGVGVERLPILFEFAAARAQQTGESVDYLVDSIVRGIGRKSILVLDNLGLSATRLREQFNGAAIASKSVAEVTEGVARIAEQELGKMGGYAETSATKVDQLTASVENLKAAFAQKQVEEGGNKLTGLFKYITDGLTLWIKGEKKLAEEQAKRVAGQQVDYIIQSKAFKENKDHQAVQLDMIFKEILQRKELLRIREHEIEVNERERQRITDDPFIFNQRTPIDALDDQLKSQKQSKAILQESVAVLMKYAAEIRKIAGDSDEEGLGLIGAKMKEISRVEDLIKTEKTLVGIEKLNQKLEILKAELHDLQVLGSRKQAPDFSKIIDFRFIDPKTGAIMKDKDPHAAFKMITESVKNLYEDAASKIDTTHRIKLKPEMPKYLMSDWEHAVEDNKEAIKQAGFNILEDQLLAEISAEASALGQMIEMRRNYYDEQVALAGDNERKKKELRIKEDREIKELEKQKHDREKKASLAAIRVSTAIGIMRVFAEPGLTFIDKLVKAGIVLAEGLSQYAIAGNQRYYAKGGIDIPGPGTGTSDSIPARLSRGESVMTAEETKYSKGVLKSIRAKTLNDRVLKELTSGKSGGTSVNTFDDSRIVKELKDLKNNQPDYFHQGNLVYESKRKGETYRQNIRKSSMGS